MRCLKRQSIVASMMRVTQVHRANKRFLGGEPKRWGAGVLA
jgi:hypothetical protein